MTTTNTTMTNNTTTQEGVGFYLDLRWAIRPYGAGYTLQYWVGRSEKSRGFYSFTDMTYLNEHLAVQKAEAERRQKYVDDIKAEMNKVIPGAILCYSWGHEQTNIDFYQVLSRSGSTIVVQEIARKTEVVGRPDSMVESNVAKPGEFVGQPIKKRIGRYGIKMDHGYLRLAEEGKKYHSTSYA